MVRAEVVGSSEGRQGSADKLDATAGEGGREQLTLDPRCRIAKDQALGLRNGDHRAPVFIPQQLGETDPEGPRHVCGRGQGRAVLPALEIGERRAADPGRGGQSLEGQSLPLPCRAHLRTEANGNREVRDIRGRDGLLYHKIDFSSIMEYEICGPGCMNVGYRAARRGSGAMRVAVLL